MNNPWNVAVEVDDDAHANNNNHNMDVIELDDDIPMIENRCSIACCLVH
jgi:hypothetical protein